MALATEPQDMLSLWVHGMACAMTGATGRARGDLQRLAVLDRTAS